MTCPSKPQIGERHQRREPTGEADSDPDERGGLAGAHSGFHEVGGLAKAGRTLVRPIVTMEIVVQEDMHTLQWAGYREGSARGGDSLECRLEEDEECAHHADDRVHCRVENEGFCADNVEDRYRVEDSVRSDGVAHVA